MKQKGNKPGTHIKPDFRQFSFWFPIRFSVINVIVLAFGMVITAAGDNVSNPELADYIMLLFRVFVIRSPTFLILFIYLLRRHSRKYPTTPSYYRVMPGIMGLIVSLIDILILVSIAGNK